MRFIYSITQILKIFWEKDRIYIPWWNQAFFALTVKNVQLFEYPVD